MDDLENIEDDDDDKTGSTGETQCGPRFDCQATALEKPAGRGQSRPGDRSSF